MQLIIISLIILMVYTLPLQIIFIIYYQLNNKNFKSKFVHKLAFTLKILLVTFLSVFVLIIYSIATDENNYLSSWNYLGEVVHEIPNSNDNIIIREYSLLHSVLALVYYVDFDGNKHEIGSTNGKIVNFTSGDYKIEFLDDGIYLFYYRYKNDEDYYKEYFEYNI